MTVDFLISHLGVDIELMEVMEPLSFEKRTSGFIKNHNNCTILDFTAIYHRSYIWNLVFLLAYTNAVAAIVAD